MSQYSERVLEFLKINIPDGHIKSGGKQYLCRCPFCGDSKHANSAHFYIKVPQEESEAMLYNCFKCGAKGKFNANTMQALGMNTNDPIASEIYKNNKKSRKITKNNIIRYNISYNKISMCSLSEMKINYINKRLGLNLGYQDMLNLKIVLNLGDILEENQINEYTRHINVVKQLDEHFLGFLSFDNSVINMRNLETGKVHENIDKRYVNYKIFNNQDAIKYYMIPTVIDLLSTEPIKIHIAEGPFDILGIFFNVCNGVLKNSIYIDISGNSYYNLVKFITTTLGIINAEYHIYFDNDVDDKTINHTTYILKQLPISIYYHWNKYINKIENGIRQYEKDYGVPKEKIKDYCKWIK